ncbi:MAG TPA: hypothetical protein VFP55_00320 [Solirubrobacteraceae bacterium]|nr:hypothetical protein [Solirubrobacteraceae bacterium]
MHWPAKRFPAPSMLVALVALFLSLSAGAYAAISLPAGSVGTRQLRRDAVTGAKLRDGAVTAVKVRTHSLLARDFASGQLPRGPQGPPGAAGSAGAPGPGFDFLTASGNQGPSLTAAGTYLVVASVALPSSPVALSGACAGAANYNGIQIRGTSFGGAVNAPPNSPLTEDISAMVVLPSLPGPATLRLSCEDSTGAAVIPTAIDWWVSKVATS